MTRAQGALLHAVALLSACASEETGSRAEAIIEGSVSAGDPAVVALVARRSRCDQVPETLCTGTLVAERVVLTAAHCLDVFGEGGSYEVVFGSAIDAPDARYVVVQEARRHPDYDEDTHAMDVAVLLLREPGPTTPMPLAAAPALGPSDLDATVRAVGFGRTGDSAMPDGIKREGTMRISAITPTAFTAVPAPALTCVGDSGGPVSIVRDAEEQLVGVTASGDFGCRERADNVRIDAVASFIEAFVAETASAPSGRPAGGIVRAELCEVECATDAECPDGLSCVSGPASAGRCVLPGAGEGRFEASCASSAECSEPGSVCARLWPDGESACACHVPCVAIGEPDAGPDDPGDGGGCGCAVPGEPTSLPLAIIALAGLLWRRARQ